MFVLDLVFLFWARACLDNAIDGIEEKRHLDPKRWHSRLLMHRRCCRWTWDEQVGFAGIIWQQQGRYWIIAKGCAAFVLTLASPSPDSIAARAAAVFDAVRETIIGK